ncbi:hypothetical protein EN814_25200 [Mesorhizobium sp. M2D.F.Ca.ET.171.01.1.1]|nr:hypothetical protein EN868_27410 [Mesorhizobium sp. M2D.F.Ca.ET.225.01.1.1]TGP73106.1 hypothetical protein EN867_23085 [Mesorhizobium sp. M2D.F.Ca.ET.224.01.1.1]TGP85746.1 hypothetical protein EN864_25645 [bacterium M00.F.Ca.ET.221.01.1.1]TGP90973.1 hypothetical protein EN865_23090 [bacterium M00.F.Ca.ET.222.01.1.1]TGQ83065.1 hypothetical protein EN849_27200 [Mesorhizobium sp. M2D.F.Ca.ET.206.01.1.1]TGS92382.1 hypothetical protein EN821_25210 [Mesorhizobium sp. M2D.F.Ca.ET.178.01.1.1]TGT08
MVPPATVIVAPEADRLIALEFVLPVRFIVPVPTAMVAPLADKLIAEAPVPLTISWNPARVSVLLAFIVKELRLFVLAVSDGAFAPALPMMTSSPAKGPEVPPGAGVQFVLVPQLVEVPPFQVLVTITPA